MNKIRSRNRTRQPAAASKPKKSSGSQGKADVLNRLDDLCERIDIVLPEVTARVAALEHLLLEKQLCTRADLRGAREFVRRQEE